MKIRGNAHVSWLCSSANNVQPNLSCFLEMLKAWKFGMDFFLVTFGLGMFWDFVGSLRDFFGVLIFGPFDDPRCVTSGVPSWVHCINYNTILIFFLTFLCFKL